MTEAFAFLTSVPDGDVEVRTTVCETVLYTDFCEYWQDGVLIQHFNFSEIEISFKNPKKL